MTRQRATYLKGPERQHAAEQAAHLYAQGATIRAIAEHMGRSYGAARALLIDAKVQLRGPGGGHPKTTDHS